jgi:predicted AlkP superfamily pyrophosphatase or phosphodiesterase
MKILVIQVAALGHDFLTSHGSLGGLSFAPMDSVFPAVTCTAQASFRTADSPAAHGMVGNGFFSREFGRPYFWEQSASLVSGPRIWDGFRAAGRTVGQLFWQQSLGADCDVLLSPAPIHKHHGGMIQDCYARPEGLYRELAEAVGRKFSLMHYWGPFASGKSTAWIAEATIQVLRRAAPDLLLTYLPHLDYELQKSGPDSERSARAYSVLRDQLEKILSTARDVGYRVLVFGDYAITEVSRPVHPNRALRESGLMAVRDVRGMHYPDLPGSRAFSVVDHQVAHVIVRDEDARACARDVLEALPGVERVLGTEGKRELGLDHPRAGDLVLVAEPGAWFAYPWWTEKRRAPDYASHVDIHNKPGYDPCELFLQLWPPMSVPDDPARIRGSHGRIGDEAKATFASDLDFESSPATLIDLAGEVRNILQRSVS